MSPTTRRWLPVVTWIVVIYTTIPFVRVLGDWFKQRWSPVVITWLVIGAVIGGAAWGALALRQWANLRRGALPWIIAVSAALIVWAARLRESPEEAVHLVEYGVLAVLVFRALRPAMPDVLVFVVGALLCVLVGTVDEIIQWLAPSRFWDWRDVALNGGAGALVQLALWRTVPAGANRPGHRSIRVVLLLAAAQAALVTLCLSNTPRLVARYAPLLPHADHLMSTRNPMAEYGLRHRIAGLGTFASRLTLDELAEQDADRSAEVAGLVDAHRHSYGRFLDNWPVDRDPFTYEMRVHLFARNRNLAKARQAGFEGADARARVTTAWYENRLLEQFFGATLERSSYRWPEGLKRRIEAIAEPERGFRSDVGAHLITIASERQLRWTLVGLILVLVGIERRLARVSRVEP